jgi:DNA replication protein DnaC
MHLVELERSLRQLRLGGMAAVLETRLRQAQAEPMASIDLIACLVSDELTRRADRLLERRRKQAGFRDPDKTLHNFDFAFNPKMNRSLVFDLATGAFIAKREDALFLGPGGTGKSHLAQAIGQAAILQGYKVLYREVHILLDELSDAVAEDTRKDYVEAVATVPLLILDDFGMRKLPHTASEDLLEIIMRRYERCSTLLTSNRPVEDWGKLLGDAAAVGSHPRSPAASWARTQVWAAQLAHQDRAGRIQGIKPRFTASAPPSRSLDLFQYTEACLSTLYSRSRISGSCGHGAGSSGGLPSQRPPLKRSAMSKTPRASIMTNIAP